MYKRLVAMALCLCLLASLLPGKALAHDEAAGINQAIADDYYQILENTNMASLSGYCGLMASWQLFFLGINDWVVSYHGNNQFDAYRDVAITSGGHRAEAYAAGDYSLEEALLAVSHDGRLDVYNLLVGFQRTNTALGAIYGHSLVIYAILDGYVYYTEGFANPMGRAGQPYRVSIADFAAYYDGWCQFEGLIHFGKKGYVANCQDYPANLILEATREVTLYSQPCAPGTGDCQTLTRISRGQRLWANALYQNPQGALYYQVSHLGLAGYVPAEDTEVFDFVFSDIGIADAQHPGDVLPGEDWTLTGRIAGEYSDIAGVNVRLEDETGRVVLDHALAKRSGVYDLQSDTFAAVMDPEALPEGNYLYTVIAQGQSSYVREGQVLTQSRELILVRQSFLVGQGEKTAPAPPAAVAEEGWVQKNGTWYCYDGGAPRTGWYCYHGADYYFRPDGSVTTGWAVIQGQRRFFSSLGCMQTGWLDTPEGKMYLQFNGPPVTGSRVIDGVAYTFSAEGLLVE